MAVTITGDTLREAAATGRIVPISGSTGFTKLSDVSLRTGAHLDPGGPGSHVHLLGRFQADVVNVPRPVPGVRGTDFDGSQVGQDGDEILGPESG